MHELYKRYTVIVLIMRMIVCLCMQSNTKINCVVYACLSVVTTLTCATPDLPYEVQCC